MSAPPYFFSGTFASPLGPMIALVNEQGHLVRLDFAETTQDDHADTWHDLPMRRDLTRIAHVQAQLDDYFLGRRRAFDLTLAAQGNPFLQSVWALLRDIPYGVTTHYGALAMQLGRPGASRAVGRANGLNPISIIIPCHRVIGADGTLTGYAGGLHRKQALLALEGTQQALAF